MTSEITQETRFDEERHAEPWRNELAKELNLALDVACWLGWWDDWTGDTTKNSSAIHAIVSRVAQFEEIKVKH